MIFIEDDIHCEQWGPFRYLEDCVTELRRLALVPSDAAPNQAPCRSWKTCGREYQIVIYYPGESTRVFCRVPALNVSAQKTAWADGFEQWLSTAARCDPMRPGIGNDDETFFRHPQGQPDIRNEM